MEHRRRGRGVGQEISSLLRRLAQRAQSLADATAGAVSPLGGVLRRKRAALQSSGESPTSFEPAHLARAGPATSNEVVDAALRLVTALAVKTIENADGVSVTLARHARLMTVAASDDAVLRMDGHQYATGEGPCLAAKADGRWYYIESLDDETRWPAFVPRALEQGIHSILSSPLMTAGPPLGALNIYSNTPKAFGNHDQELAALFASQASEILAAAETAGGEADPSRRFAEGLASRQTIAHAQGILMGRNGITPQQAMVALRDAAQVCDETVLEQAARVVASTVGEAGEKSDPS